MSQAVWRQHCWQAASTASAPAATAATACMPFALAITKYAATCLVRLALHCHTWMTQAAAASGHISLALLLHTPCSFVDQRTRCFKHRACGGLPVHDGAASQLLMLDLSSAVSLATDLVGRHCQQGMASP